MTSDYRESYIYQLKKDNQVLWGELQELPYGSLAYKRVRREIEANNTEISTMQDIIKRSAPIAVEADFETKNHLVNA